MASPRQQTALSGRTVTGQFVAGNPGGPGNPHARRVAALRVAMLDAITPDAMAAIIGTLMNAAMNGDVQAAKLLLAYAVGKPSETVDPDRLEHLEWETAKALPTALDRMMREMGGG
jgi:hypothetical protein